MDKFTSYSRTREFWKVAENAVEWQVHPNGTLFGLTFEDQGYSPTDIPLQALIVHALSMAYGKLTTHETNVQEKLNELVFACIDVLADTDNSLSHVITGEDYRHLFCAFMTLSFIERRAMADESGVVKPNHICLNDNDPISYSRMWFRRILEEHGYNKLKNRIEAVRSQHQTETV